MKKSIQTPLGVYTDDEVGIEMIESYANQRVVEELEKQMELAEGGNIYTRLRERIKELKQK